MPEVRTIEQIDARPAIKGKHVWGIGFVVEGEGFHGSRFEGTIDQALDALRDQVRPHLLGGRTVRYVCLAQETSPVVRKEGKR